MDLERALSFENMSCFLSEHENIQQLYDFFKDFNCNSVYKPSQRSLAGYFRKHRLFVSMLRLHKDGSNDLTLIFKIILQVTQHMREMQMKNIEECLRAFNPEEKSGTELWKDMMVCKEDGLKDLELYIRSDFESAFTFIYKKDGKVHDKVWPTHLDAEFGSAMKLISTFYSEEVNIYQGDDICVNLKNGQATDCYNEKPIFEDDRKNKVVIFRRYLCEDNEVHVRGEHFEAFWINESPKSDWLFERIKARNCSGKEVKLATAFYPALKYLRLDHYNYDWVIMVDEVGDVIKVREFILTPLYNTVELVNSLGGKSCIAGVNISLREVCDSPMHIDDCDHGLGEKSEEEE